MAASTPGTGAPPSTVLCPMTALAVTVSSLATLESSGLPALTLGSSQATRHEGPGQLHPPRTASQPDSRRAFVEMEFLSALVDVKKQTGQAGAPKTAFQHDSVEEKLLF